MNRIKNIGKNRFYLLWLSKMRKFVRKCNLMPFGKSEIDSLKKRGLIETSEKGYDEGDGVKIMLYLTEKGDDVLNKIECHPLSRSYKLWNEEEITYLRHKIPEIL